MRFAARVALEHQPVSEWSERALAERDPQASLSALLALSRQGGKELQEPLLDAISKLPSAEMDEAQKLELLRIMGLCIIRMGKPTPRPPRRSSPRSPPTTQRQATPSTASWWQC